MLLGNNAGARALILWGAVDIAEVARVLGPVASSFIVVAACATIVVCTWLETGVKNQGVRKATPAHTPKGSRARKARVNSKSK